MKLISWNVNGLRACVQKGFLDFFHEADADIFCVQETKLQEGQIQLELEVTNNIGTMQRRKVIPERRYLQRKYRYLCVMASVWKNMTVKVV